MHLLPKLDTVLATIPFTKYLGFDQACNDFCDTSGIDVKIERAGRESDESVSI